VLAILAIIFAIVSRRNLGYFDGFSVAGLVIGIFGLVFSLFVGFLAVSGIITEFTQEFENALEEIEGGGTTDSF
jgi:ABC-type lipoprotein release transport system permease subunit